MNEDVSTMAYDINSKAEDITTMAEDIKTMSLIAKQWLLTLAVLSCQFHFKTIGNVVIQNMQSIHIIA